jgi:hypothetical protein
MPHHSLKEIEVLSNVFIEGIDNLHNAHLLICYFQSYMLSNEASIGKHLDKPTTVAISDSSCSLYDNVTKARTFIKEFCSQPD